MQIIQSHHQGMLLRKPFQQHPHRAQHALPCLGARARRGLGRAVRNGKHPSEKRELVRAQTKGHWLELLQGTLERFDDDRERHSRLELGSPSRETAEAPRRRAPPGLTEQSRLAYPGLAPEARRTAAALGQSVQQPLEQSQLGFAADEPLARARIALDRRSCAVRVVRFHLPIFSIG